MSSKGGKKKKSSLDYPQLARMVVAGAAKASGNEGAAQDDAPEAKFEAGLYVVATPIGNLGDVTLRALVTLASCDIVACEDTRNSGLLLQKYGIKKRLISYHDHNADEKRPEILKHIEAGEAVALISDAGLPLVADPGFRLVRGCVDAGYSVTVIPGASAGLTALAASGLPTDAFYFAGFLPPKTSARIKDLESLKPIEATLIFYEAPQRLAASLKDMHAALGNRGAAVARELTKLFEEVKRGELHTLAAYYAAHPPKGEIVVIVAPPGKNTEVSGDPDEILRALLRTESLRDAVAIAVEATGMKKSEIYARALWLSGKSGK